MFIFIKKECKGDYFDLKDELYDFLVDNGYKPSTSDGLSDSFPQAVVYINLSVSSEKMSQKEAMENLINQISGLDFSTDWCGWGEYTIENIYIDTLSFGGHNLLKILSSYNNKYAILKIEIKE